MIGNSCYISGMEVTVKIPDEIAAQAEARGMRVEAYVQEILARQVRPALEARTPRSSQEIRAWLDSLAQFSDKIPPCQTQFPASGFIRTTTKCRLLRV
jgi:hypothetical protein